MFARKNSKRVAISIGAGLLIIAGIGAGTLPRTQGQANDVGYYYGLGDKKVELTFQPDRVGLLTRERVTRAQIAEIAASLGLKIEKELSGGMFILIGGGLATRRDSVALARKLRTQFTKQVRDAGFVVAASDDKNPQVVSDDVLLRELPKSDPKETAKLLDSLGMKIVKRLRGGTVRASVTDKAPFDALDGARYLKENKLVGIAEPNRHYLAELFEQIPADPFFSNQWHHRNTGASGGTVDADSDTTLAWDFTFGSANTVIAVVDNTFDLAHEDLAVNVATNALEMPGNGIDDDGNGYIDDVTGWDFVSDDNDPSPVNVRDNHGTAVAGVAVAAVSNGVGVSGACPGCRFIPLTIFNNCVGNTCTSSVAGFAEAIDYATFSNAQIINNSWGKTNPAAAADAIVVAAINDAAAAGKVVVFSGGNSPSSAYCNAGYPSLGNVIAVSSSSNLDRKVNGHAFGNCIDVLAPTRWGAQDSSPTGTLAVTTTDRTGANGYNSADPSCISGLVDPANTNYTHCFSGTSSAAPLVAGVAGLLLSARPSLTRVQIQRLLQDTTDHNEDSLASYSSEFGYSAPGGQGTHAFGRINAGEAVRVAAAGKAGKDGVDVFLRDNRLDWGNTEHPSNQTFEPVRGYLGHWKSVDIKIDAPPYQAAPSDSASFEALVDEKPREGDLNKVYVRIRNRGPVSASSVALKLHWTQFGTALPTLPGDFWTAFPADSVDTSQWHPMGVVNISDLAYSGPSIAGCPGRAAPACDGAVDAAQIATFDWTGPSVPSGTPNHFCLFAVASSGQDPVAAASTASFVPDDITPNDNNVTHRNVQVETVGSMADYERSFFVRNPTRSEARTVVRVNLPKEWKVSVSGVVLNEAFTLKRNESRVVKVRITPPGPDALGEVEFVQEIFGANKVTRGGAVFSFAKPAK